MQNPRDTGSWLKYALIGIAIVFLVIVGVVVGGIGIVLSQVLK